ncbi:hypothetical protein [Halostella pelagica]|uniref:hypothetical protein n=1 Tax=Halostella pelagica TaxID=2583824 RepID=UPI0010811BA8|nr:hypothetical protein [Halostella pelagica]
MTNDDRDQSVPDVFDNKEAIGLIACIDRKDGNIVKELRDRTGASEDTVRDRLSDAIAAGLIEEKTITADDHPRSQPYQLTERGKSVQSLLRVIGLDRVYNSYLAREQELEDALPEVRGLIREEGLHEEYRQSDFWMRSDSSTEAEEREELRAELGLDVTKRANTSSNKSDSDEKSGDSVEEDDDRGKVETWGESPDEDNRED